MYLGSKMQSIRVYKFSKNGTKVSLKPITIYNYKKLLYKKMSKN